MTSVQKDTRKTPPERHSIFFILENILFLQLTQIENSSNYFDESGFVYSPNNSKNTKNSYFRCKYSNKKNCYARVIVKNGHFKKAILTHKHSHAASKLALCKTKVDKKMENECKLNEFLTTCEIYFNVRDKIDADDVEYIPNRKSYGYFVHRRKRRNAPKISISFQEFEDSINDEKYRQRYKVLLLDTIGIVCYYKCYFITMYLYRRHK